MSATTFLQAEEQGIAPVSAAQAHGSPKAMFGLWMSANIEFATLTTGALATGVFGLSGPAAFAAILLANVLGGALLALFSTYGVEYGLPQMIQGARWFGATGNRLPSFLNFFGGFSWFAVNSIIGGYALQYILGTPLIASVLALCIVQVVIAAFGHDLIQRVEKYAMFVLIAIFAVLSVLAVMNTPLLADAQPKLQANVGGGSGAFILTVSVMLAYLLGWIPYSSDYTRYLAHARDTGATKRSVMINVFFGSLISCVWMEALGAVIGASVTLEHPSDLFTTWMPSWFKSPMIVAIVLGTITANVVNIYSATLSALALGIKLKQPYAAALSGLLGTAIAVLAAQGFIKNYESFLFFLGYWTAPWIAVVLLGHFAGRESRTSAISAGFIAWIAGIAASIPFFNQYPLFVGWVANAHPEWGDVSFAVSFIVASVAYMALTRKAVA